MQRIVLAITRTALLAALIPAAVTAQDRSPIPDPQSPIPNPQSPIDLEALEPLLPPGISEFNLELHGKLAYTWPTPDGTGIIEIQGNFSANMGQYKLASRDAVIWHRNRQWRDRTYIDMEIFLWQGAEIVQPAGTVETGPALVVTLRTFGKLILNTDGWAGEDVSDADSDLFREGLRARGLLDVAPPPEPEQSPAPIRLAPTLGQLRRMATRKEARTVEFSVDPDTGQLYHQEYAGQSVIIAMGDVLVSQGSPAKSGEYLELHADAAVLYLKADQVGGAIPGFLGEEGRSEGDRSRQRRGVDDLDNVPEEPQSPIPNRQSPIVSPWVSAVYLEGDVVLTRGQRMIRAARLSYDFDAERALILDVVTRAIESSRGLPIYVRAEEVRQLSSAEYEARDAQITTSEFYTPHVAIGADKVYLKDRTPRNERGEIIGVQAGTYEAYHTTLNLEGVPIAYWPFSRGDFSRDRMAFRSAKVGYNSDFGGSFETRWYLFNLLGLQQPDGYDATLKMDYFTDRGPGVGVDVDYEREDYFGLLRTYYIHDTGEDDLGGGRGGEPDTNDRGRALWRHRQYLPKDWELSLEAAYISDDNFLESYERNEWENAKDQETAIYLVKRQDNWQFSTLANWRINEFLTQTEHLPDVMFSLIGEPIGDIATLYHESRAGVVRRRPDDRIFLHGHTRADNLGETGSVIRGDARDELQFPLPDLGPLKLTPYVTGRATGWDDSPASYRSGTVRSRSQSGGRGRFFGAYGIQGNTIFTKVDDSIESQLLDLHRMRHVMKAEVNAWNAHSNSAPERLTPFDSGVEDIDDFGGVVMGLRQRFQTQRGGPGRWRTVDWITFDIEAGFFNDAQRGEDTHGDLISHRPEDSISSNFLAMDFQYRISDTTVVVYDGVYDWNRGNVGTSNISLAVEREPRMAYFLGWRYIHDTENSLIGAGANYRLNEKHTVAIREYYDIERGKNYTTELIYVRRWPRWYTAIAFDVDRSLDDIGINLSIWPEGAPRLGLGSKRYTGLADSVGIKLR
ncbi:MAG: LPS-assembly protein LptD [Phycisphaerae bacterium]|nr:LPS-assembly protein LptD [Phycisphaerae bacterium]